MPVPITSFTNATVKLLRSLHDKKHREAEGLFLAEGMRIVTEAVEAGHVPHLLAHGAAVRAHPLLQRLVQATEAEGGRVLEVSDEILAKIARKDNPQMVVAAFALPDLSLARLDLHKLQLILVLEALKDPGNLGTILRTGDAVGASAIILIDHCCDPFATEAVRSSMGALFTQQLVQTTFAAFLPWMRMAPAQLIGASLNASHDYRDISYTQPCFLFMGNEQSGLPDAYEQACDALVKIPMLGKADSLNVAISTAVLAYEIRNQWRDLP